MEFWDKKLGLGIKLRRKEMNIRQVDLAERLHVEPTTISRWETGSGSPDISILPNLAYELGTSVDDLLGNKKRNKEDEIKKEKINFVKLLSNFCRVLFIVLILFAIVLELFLKISILNMSYLWLSILDKYIILFIINFLAFIFIFSNKLKRDLIYWMYKYKYTHKYPIGYKFIVKEKYIYFLNIVIFIIILFFDVLLILG